MDETVRIWATVTGDLIDIMSEGVVHPITSVALSPGGALLAEASNDFTVRVWDIKQGW
jgi:WD40 repeat protein